MICERLADGASLRQIIAEPGMPSIPAIFRWLEANEEFRNQYAHARALQADVYADEIPHIADNTESGCKTKTGPNGTEITEGDMIEHRRLRIDARKWAASKLAPKKYGERVTQDVNFSGLEGMLDQIAKKPAGGSSGGA